MVTPVLVALTPGPRGEETLRLAVRMAQLFAQPLVLGGVAVPVPASSGADIAGWASPPIEDGQLESEVRAQLEMMAETVPVGMSTTIAVSIAHTVASGVEDLAEQHHAGLIVLGAPHRGLLARLFAGDPDMGILRHASCPVLVAAAEPKPEPRTRPDGLGRIGVAWDRSVEAHESMRLAASLAAAAGAVLEVIHVLEPSSMPLVVPIDPEVVRAVRDENVAEAEREIRLMLSTLDVETPADVDIRHGSVGDELVAASAAVDLLVMGSLRVGPLRRVIVGSASAHLAHRGHAPVLVVPRRVGVAVAA